MRHRVVDEQPVLEVLTRVGEGEPEQLGDPPVPAYETVGLSRTTSPPSVTTTLREAGVATHPRCLRGQVDRGVVPLLQGHEREVRAVADEHLDRTAVGGASRCARRTTTALANGFDVDDHVPYDVPPVPVRVSTTGSASSPSTVTSWPSLKSRIARAAGRSAGIERRADQRVVGTDRLE